MNFQEFIKLMRKSFFAELDAKTGWGKEQVKQLFNEVMTDVLASGFNKQTKQQGGTNG